MIVRKIFKFEAAHFLPYHDGKCARVHGHSYRLEVALEGAIRSNGSDAGMVMDFGDLSAIVDAAVIQRIDHYSLNDFVDNPTCERVVMWIAEHLSDHLPQLHELVLWETATACAVIRFPGVQPVTVAN